MKEDITQLRALQAIDLQISKLDGDMIAGNADIEKRQTAIEERKVTIAKLEDKIAASESRRRELEAELEDELSRIKDRQTKLMNVQTNREYQSLLKETEDGKKANTRREDDIVQLMEQVEKYKSKLEEEANVCTSEEKLLGQETKKVEKQAAELNKKKEKIEKERITKAKKISAPVLKKYDLLREKRNGIAVVGVTE
ncbi:MAG: hypothetical protein KJ732_05870, partial [Candidatus Margulisbacteria bacterium]|nr:hypothetical protein [Candidatus Margulisiibacteriota bacterium]